MEDIKKDDVLKILSNEDLTSDGKIAALNRFINPETINTENLNLAPPRKEIKLDLACGKNKKDETYIGVDLYAPEADIKADLFKFPYPWADDSVDEIYCSHFIEHLPAAYITEKDLLEPTEENIKNFVGKDFLCGFMDECWRILKVGCSALIIVPNAFSNRGFQDPTHRRFIVAETFAYFNEEWRISAGIEHYLAKCNFAIKVNPIVSNEINLLHPERQNTVLKNNINSVVDWHALLFKKELGT